MGAYGSVGSNQAEGKKIGLKRKGFQIAVSLGALLTAAIHLCKPDLKIDSITVVLLVIAVLPWAQGVIESVDLGLVKIRLSQLQDRFAAVQETATGASQQATLALTATGTIGKLGGKRVLWVDDQPENNEHGIKALQAQGIEVVTCKTTREALEQVERGKFNVIITDQLRYEQGVRKDRAGYELTSQLLQGGVKVPVILSTAQPKQRGGTQPRLLRRCDYSAGHIRTGSEGDPRYLNASALQRGDDDSRKWGVGDESRRKLSGPPSGQAQPDAPNHPMVDHKPPRTART